MDQANSPSGSESEHARSNHAAPLHRVETADPSEPSLPPAVASESPRIKPSRPKFVFFGSLAALVLCLDVLSKAWAEIELSKRPLAEPGLELIRDHLSLTLAYNKGGAWGLLQDASELIRKPFFFAVSIAAILFIVSLYTRLAPEQRALKWGLPLVLGGALGNLADRIARGSVVDFIDYRSGWVVEMNRLIAKLAPAWNITDHWPTFNVADVSICIGVGLMAVDMIATRRNPQRAGGSGGAPGDLGTGGADIGSESRRTEGAPVARES